MSDQPAKPAPPTEETSYVPFIAVGFVLFCIFLGFVMLGLAIFYFDQVGPGQKPAIIEPMPGSKRR